MDNLYLIHDVTPIALEHYAQRGFEIAFEVFHKVLESDERASEDFLLAVGQEELYESLMYHKDIINSVFVTKNYRLIEEFFVWKYSVYQSRGVDVEYFLVEYDLWKQSIANHLYPSHSSEISTIYDYLIVMHRHFKHLALTPKKVIVDKQYKNIFDDLSRHLIAGEKKEFFGAIEQTLPLFGGDLFGFIEQIINPLMYQIGHLWQHNQLSVAKEHLATALVSEIIDTFLVKPRMPHIDRPKAIVSTVGDESHNLGVKIIGKFLECCGYDVDNLGSKIPNNELLTSVYERSPNLLVLSVTLTSNIAKLQNLVNELKSGPNAFKGLIVVGGQALFGNEKSIPIEGADFSGNSLDELKNFLTLTCPKR